MNKKFLLKLPVLLWLTSTFLSSCGDDSGTASDADGFVIPFVIENGYMIVEATISGKSGRFVFDSGASNSRVPEAHTSDLPLQIMTRFVDGKPRPEYLYKVENVEFANGSVKASSWLTKYRKNSMEFTSTDGILGNGVFAGYWVEIAFSRNEIVLYEHFPERYTHASHSPLIVSFNNQLSLTIDVDGRNFLMLVDTGLSRALFFSGVIAEGMDSANLRRIASNGEVRNFYLMRTNSLAVMDMSYNDKLIMSNSYAGARNPPESHYGLMGIGFMQHYDLLLDYRTILPDRTNDDSAGMFYIPIVAPEERDYGFYSFLDAAPEFGILPGCSCGCDMDYGCCKASDLKIYAIFEDSEAYALGLRPGSDILELDGMSVGSFSFDEISDPYFYDRFTEFTARVDDVEVTLRRNR